MSMGNAGGKLLAGMVVYALLTFASPAVAQTNAWIKPTSGNWAETNAWSLGQVPSTSQEIYITNSGTKTVTIDSSTAQSAASSLSIDWLRVEGPNTLLIDNVTNTQFNVNILTYVWTSGRVLQLGGSSHYNTIYMLSDAVFALTNATSEIGSLESVDAAYFIQDGGNSKFSSLKFAGGTNILKNGSMEIDNTLACVGIFEQSGGTNRANSLSVARTTFPVGSGEYALDNNGALFNDSVLIGPDGTFNNNSGIHIVTNTLTIQGSARYYPPVPIPARYQCTGSLTARALVVDASSGFSHFSASGDVHITESISFPGIPDLPGTFSIAGNVTCSNLLSQGAVIDMTQTSGTLIVTNLFSFSGVFPGYYSNGSRPAQFLFSGGTISASNINVTAEWTIQSSNSISRITNAGTFTFAGLLHLIDGTESLGRFILSSNAVIDLGGSTAKLSFANSSASDWNASSILAISNWNGSISGGGVDQLVFGSDANGLNANQLQHIRFINPSGLPIGTYFAQILSSGEVVPASRPELQLQANASSIIVSWPNNWILQRTTNLWAPFVDISTASPYTNSLAVSPEMYFRLRSP